MIIQTNGNQAIPQAYYGNFFKKYHEIAFSVLFKIFKSCWDGPWNEGLRETIAQPLNYDTGAKG